MKEKLLSILRLLAQSPQKYPVEALLGFTFFIIACYDTSLSHWDNDIFRQVESGINSSILWFFVPLMALTFWLHRVNRWGYYLSYFLFLPLMTLDLKSYIGTCVFFLTYLLAGILLLVRHQPMDNKHFGHHALHLVIQMFFGLLISGILNLAVFAIVASFLYIFGLEEPNHLFEYIIQFIWFFIAPLVCCTLIGKDEDLIEEPAKVLQLIINYILSPAVVIYTVILYVYFIKIALVWDLPKGGVAWMVIAFIVVALIAYVAQYVLPDRHYDWFFRRFTWIAIPPLLLFWIGSIYRIRQYSFTEDRIYMIVAGVLMTLFMVMLLWHHTRRFQWMALITGLAIILFTFIPGITAKRLGLHCQMKRMEKMAAELKFINPSTHQLIDKKIDFAKICEDSLLKARWQDALNTVCYVRDEMGEEQFKTKYGEWSYDKYSVEGVFNGMQIMPYEIMHELKDRIELGKYHVMKPTTQYSINYVQGILSVYYDGGGQRKTVMNCVMRCDVFKDDTLGVSPYDKFVYQNDSLMLVLHRVIACKDSIYDVTKDFQLFGVE